MHNAIYKAKKEIKRDSVTTVAVCVIFFISLLYTLRYAIYIEKKSPQKLYCGFDCDYIIAQTFNKIYSHNENKL